MKYTIVPNIDTLNKLNTSKYLNHRDYFIINQFGGKSFTKDEFLTKVKNYLIKRNNSNSTVKYIPKQLFNWWIQRNAIFCFDEE